MKRFLFLFVMGIAFIQLANAQVIELIGKGVLNVNTETLTFDDPSSIDHVVVVASAIYHLTTPGEVEFYETGDGSEDITATFTSIPAGSWKLENDPNPDFEIGYFTATFNNVDADGISLDKTSEGVSVKSFTAYVYRKNSSPGNYSEVKGDHAFLWRNGSQDPLIYKFAIDASSNPKDVVVSLPFTDLESNDRRWANVILTAGTQSVESSFDLNNAGDLLHLETLQLTEVPGEVTEVMVTVYSPLPTNGVDTENGDSFIINPVLLTVNEESRRGCTLTQGYWKTHSKYGPAKKEDPTWELIGPDAGFFSSGKSYIEVLNTAVSGNNYYILAHQYIAAELNVLGGADDSAVITELAEAKSLLENYSPEDVSNLNKKDSEEKAILDKFVSLGSTLDDYNNGRIGPGHCEEEEEESEKDTETNEEELSKSVPLLESLSLDDVKIIPTLVRTSAKISFTTVVAGKTTIEIFSPNGNSKDIFSMGNLESGASVEYEFTPNGYRNGYYIVLIKNGNVISYQKLRIKK